MEQTIYGLMVKVDEQGILDMSISLCLTKAEAQKRLKEVIEEEISLGAKLVEKTKDMLVLQMGPERNYHEQIYFIEEIEVPFEVKKGDELQLVTQLKQNELPSPSLTSTYVVCKDENIGKAIRKAMQLEKELIKQGFMLDEEEEVDLEDAGYAFYVNEKGEQAILNCQTEVI